MATRKAITLVSGLFQEVNTPTDKLDFAGNTTADLGENTNLYFTNARARGAVSVTDAGGQGSLAYNSSTGVITYTGPSSADTRGELSVASGSGLTYNSGTGEFGTSAIPNGQLGKFISNDRKHKCFFRSYSGNLCRFNFFSFNNFNSRNRRCCKCY